MTPIILICSGNKKGNKKYQFFKKVFEVFCLPCIANTAQTASKVLQALSRVS
jgi:hypothetical protein